MSRALTWGLDALLSPRSVAIVGASDTPTRIGGLPIAYLKAAGFSGEIYPVNPTVEMIDGVKCYPSVEAIPVKIDLVDVFRRPEYTEAVVDDAIAAGAKAVWLQLGIHHDGAVQKAVSAGLDIVSDLCIKIEYARLMVPNP